MSNLHREYLRRAYEQMKDGEWRTLKTIAIGIGASPLMAGAALRTLCASGYVRLNRRLVDGRFFEYRCVSETKQARV